MPSARYDVAIVGAGPAGAWCAHQLAAAGVKVAILDGSHPREKPCGGGVTARAMTLIGSTADAAGAPIDRATFAYGRRRAHVTLRRARTRRLAVFSRRDFDERLLARAVAVGAELIPERATNVLRESRDWRLTTRTRELEARWIVGADGANSLVRRRVARPFEREDLSIACGYFIPGVTSSCIDIAFVAKPAGYLWSFPRCDHLAIGVCAQADVASVATLMPIVDAWVRDGVRSRDDGSPEGPHEVGTLERYSWPIPSLRAAALQGEQPSGDGWMLLGDAAGLVDPITREGIFFALQSAGFAAAHLISGRGPSAAYAQQLRDEVFPELMAAAQLKQRFYRPAFMSLLLQALQRSDRIGAVMVDLVAGEQPYHSLRKRLLKTCEFRLMWDLLSAHRTK